VVVLRAGTSFEGVVYLNGPGRVDGCLTGQIVAKRSLIIGADAAVRARVDAEEVIIAGQVEGDVSARARIELRPTGRVRGALRAPRLVLADGCFVDGDCSAGDVA
jgi:cytoskeletal protein CcmA (bactofilin family)